MLVYFDFYRNNYWWLLAAIRHRLDLQAHDELLVFYRSNNHSKLRTYVLRNSLEHLYEDKLKIKSAVKLKVQKTTIGWKFLRIFTFDMNYDRAKNLTEIPHLNSIREGQWLSGIFGQISEKGVQRVPGVAMYK